MSDISKSAKMKRYKKVYDRHMNENLDQEPSIRKEKVKETKEPSIRKEKVKETKEPSIRKLNDYQLFVKDESKKSKYHGLNIQERMQKISKAWKKKKEE